jgi:membrane protein DedA with SNARE-associated domain
MIHYILALLSKVIIVGISSLGYGGVVIAMAIESACIPLPSEIIMPFGGYLVATRVFSSPGGDMMALFYVALAGAFGCVVGSLVAYYVGIWGGRPFLEKYGKYVLISKDNLDTADKWFKKYGDMAIFTSRLLPVIRTFISFPAGIMKMNFPKFVVYTFLGSLPWTFALAWIGYKIGQRATTIIEWTTAVETRLGKFMHVIDAVIILAFVLLAAWYVRRHLKPSKAKNDE